VRFQATAATILLALTATSLAAHDMFWRLTTYFVPVNSAIRLPVLNGTFSSSENAIDWVRVADLSVVSPAGRVPMDSARWDTRGDTSWLSLTTGASGTYVSGLSTRPKELRMEAQAFNEYLADDGIPDVLAARRASGIMDSSARERYSKHIKAIFQVGPARSSGWETVLGYPAELIPLANPYATSVGQTLRVRCMVDGQPVANQLVMVGGRAGSRGDIRFAQRRLRTDAQGVVAVRIDRPGRWYVKFIHMVPVNTGQIEYESKWSTLTFEIR
jgi:hypothetical protein